MDSPTSTKAERRRYCDRESMKAPLTHCFLITPDADNELPVCTRAIILTANGTIKGTFENDEDHDSSPGAEVTLTLLAGVQYDFCFKQVTYCSTSVHGLY